MKKCLGYFLHIRILIELRWEKIMKAFLNISKFFGGGIALFSGIVSLIPNSVAVWTIAPAWLKTAYIFTLFLAAAVFAAGGIIELVQSIKNSAKNHHEFKYQSEEYIAFFTKWYSNPGALSIICDDMNWISYNEDKRIFEALSKKCSEGLSMFVCNDYNTSLVRQLKEKGAKVYKAPQRIVRKYTFSCMSVMGNTAGRIIVRDKDKDAEGVVIFDEISNTYVTGLLNELLENEKEEIR